MTKDQMISLVASLKKVQTKAMQSQDDFLVAMEILNQVILATEEIIEKGQ